MNAPEQTRFGRGQPASRREDHRLLTGQGRYADDLATAGQLHCVFVRSPFAHANIRSVDTRAALAMPGVVAILTGQSIADDGVHPIPGIPGFKRADGNPSTYPTRRALTLDRARFAGEAVAAVIAETRMQAQDAAEAVLVDYEVLPAVTDTLDATRPDAPQVVPDLGTNIVATTRHGKTPETDAAFAQAAHIVSLEIDHQRLIPFALEPRASLASYDAATDRITLETGIQTPGRTRDGLAGAVLKIAPDKLRVLVRDIGGGFGMKTGVYPEDVVVAYAARKLGRPVKWRADRSEEFLAGTHGRGLYSKVSLALDAEGRILGLRVHSFANLGAYCGGPGPAVQGVLGPFVSTGVYDIRNLDLRVDCVLTNTGIVAPYRGAGRPENVFNIERLIDRAAREMKIDPLELRRRNFIPKEAMPYKNAMLQTYDSGDFRNVMEKCIALADWDGYPARKAESARRGRLRGRGIAAFLEWTGGGVFTEKVRVQVRAEGRITIWSATQAMGQGLETSYAQLAAEQFGLDPSAIEIVQGDTDVVAGFGSVGSRSAYVGGSAVDDGAKKTIEAGRERASRVLEAAAQDIVYAKGRYTIGGTDRGVSLFDLAQREPTGSIVVDAEYTVGGESWPNGCHVSEVEIDPETGVVQLVKFTAVDDVGNPINPMIVGGQIHGGVAQGVGQALFEHARYDPESGQLVTGSLMDYCLPRADDLPDIQRAIDTSQPCRNNPLGAKGCGESGTIGSAPATVNAILDALADHGVRHIEMPVTAEKVWHVLAGKA